MYNGISRPYQLNGSISNLQFRSNFKSSFCKQIVWKLISRRLIWFCTVYWCPIKWTLGLYSWIELQSLVSCNFFCITESKMHIFSMFLRIIADKCLAVVVIFESVHEISNNQVCATSKASD